MICSRIADTQKQLIEEQMISSKFLLCNQELKALGLKAMFLAYGSRLVWDKQQDDLKVWMRFKSCLREIWDSCTSGWLLWKPGSFLKLLADIAGCWVFCTEYSIFHIRMLWTFLQWLWAVRCYFGCEDTFCVQSLLGASGYSCVRLSFCTHSSYPPHCPNQTSVVFSLIVPSCIWKAW